MDSLTVYLNDRPVGRLDDVDLSRRMAMKIDGEYAIKWITRSKFLRMAGKLGLEASLMDREIERMCRRITRHAPLVTARLSTRFPSGCYQLICEGIANRVSQLAVHSSPSD